MLIEFYNTQVFYEGHLALDIPKLAIPLQQSCVILGQNGSGKSTFLKLLTQENHPAIRPDLSFKLLGKRRWNIFELRKQIGFVSNDMQFLYLDHEESVRYIVLSGFFASNKIRSFNAVSAAQKQATELLLNELNIQDLATKKFGCLSTGQQRRVLIARALVHMPHTLVIDEPTSGLDIKNSYNFLRLLNKLSTHGLTVLLVTHHIAEILPAINRILLMKAGKIVADGDKATILNSIQLSDLFNLSIQVKFKDGWYDTEVLH